VEVVGVPDELTWKLYLGNVLWKRTVWKMERTASDTWRASRGISNTCGIGGPEWDANVGRSFTHLRPGVHDELKNKRRKKDLIALLSGKGGRRREP